MRAATSSRERTTATTEAAPLRAHIQGKVSELPSARRAHMPIGNQKPIKKPQGKK